MIHCLDEIPSVGDEIISAENPMGEFEKLQCVLVKPDVEDPSIVFAFFTYLDSPDLNDKEEDGIKFYCMKGYSNYHE